MKRVSGGGLYLIKINVIDVDELSFMKSVFRRGS
jgi:hypothetical protein